MSHSSSIDSNDRQIIIPSQETHDLSRIRLLTMAQRAEIFILFFAAFWLVFSGFCNENSNQVDAFNCI